ncbi:MAG: tubulin-like doman-containing protein [Pirellulaceae bacterium]
MADDTRAIHVKGTGDAEKRPTGFVPTLIIGLGGSGKDVVMRLRRRFYETYGAPTSGFVSTLILDTNMDPGAFVPTEEPPEAYTDDILPGPSESFDCQISEAQFNGVFDDIEFNKETEFSDWLNPKLRRLGVASVQDGCGTQRQFGRMAFMLNRRDIASRIESQIQRVLAFPNQRNQHPSDPIMSSIAGAQLATDAIEVVIIGSLAGGTGSGMLIDMAYLVKDIMSKRKELKSSKTFSPISLIAFLPAAFDTIQDENKLSRFQQNTYAALLELEYYGTPRSGDELFLGRAPKGEQGSSVAFQAPWKSAEDDPIKDCGWEACYLLDNINPLRHANPLSRAELFQMTSDYLFLDFCENKFSQTKRASRSNNVQFREYRVETQVNASKEERRKTEESLSKGGDILFATHQGCTFSSFGLAEITFDKDRVFRAAGFRLAMHLVSLKWLGAERDFTAPQYGDWTTNDLFSKGARPSFMPANLMGLLYDNEKKNWLARVQDDFTNLRNQPFTAGSSPLRATITKHQGNLSTNPAGERGRALQTVEVSANHLVGTPTQFGLLRKRLSELTTSKADQSGVAVTLALLERYRKGLAEARTKAGDFKKAGDQRASEALARLDEASTVPFPARSLAMGIEYPRACDACENHTHSLYRRASAEKLEQLYAASTIFVGKKGTAPPPELKKWGTLHRTYSEYQSFLETLGGSLESRFEDLCQAKGSDRKKLLFTSNWDNSTYDTKINTSMINSFVGSGTETTKRGNFGYNFEHLEQRVLQQLAALDPTQFSTEVETLSQILDHWWRRGENQHERIPEVADKLGNACKKLLEETGLDLDDHADGNIVDLLYHEAFAPQRTDLINNLVDNSAPYFPTSDRVFQVVKGFDTVPSNLVGFEVGKPNDPGSEKNLEDLKREVLDIMEQKKAKAEDVLQGDSSSVMVCREMTGIPLQYYSKLEMLAKEYENGIVSECHLHYRETWEDLPDVRLMQASTYGKIQQDIHNVVLATLNGTIYCKDGVFFVRVKEQYSPTPQAHRLGTRINRLIKHACEKGPVMAALVQAQKRWEQKADARKWSLLYLAAQETYTSATKAVQFGNPEFTPLQNCTRRLLDSITKSLSETEEGRRWLVYVSPPQEEDVDDFDEAFAEYRKIIAKIIEDGVLYPVKAGVPIYQVNWKIVDKVSLPDSENVGGDSETSSTE